MIFELALRLFDDLNKVFDPKARLTIACWLERVKRIAFRGKATPKLVLAIAICSATQSINAGTITIADSSCADFHQKLEDSWLATENRKPSDTRPSILHLIDTAAYALCRARGNDGELLPQVKTAANSIELLLDDDAVHAAEAIVNRWTELENQGEFTSPESKLLRELVVARILSLRDSNAQSLSLREAIQEQIVVHFGTNSNESIGNQARIANLQIETGNLQGGLEKLQELASHVADGTIQDGNLDYLVNKSLALAHALAGDEDTALQALLELKESLNKSRELNSTRLVEIDEDIASVLIREERIDDALAAESGALLWRIKNQSISDSKTLRSLWVLAYIYILNGRTDSAESILQLVRHELLIQESSINEQLLLQTQSRIASLAANRGDFASAASIWERVYLRDTQILGGDASDTQIEAGNFAIALMHKGELMRACDILRATLLAQSKSRPRDVWVAEYTRISYDTCRMSQGSKESVRSARESLEATWAAISIRTGNVTPHGLLALATLAKATQLDGDRDVAKLLLTRLVRDAESYRQALLLGMGPKESELGVWIEGKTRVGNEILGYRDLALLHAEDGELESALRVSELARDRLLGDRFTEQDWRRASLPAGAHEQLDGLIDGIQRYDEGIAAATDVIERVRLEAARTLLVGERGRLERRLRDELRIASPAFRPPTLDELRATLPATTALVAVTHSGDAWWSLVIRRDAPARFVRFADADLGRNAAAWVRRLRGEPARAWPLPAGRIAVQWTRPEGAIGPYLPVVDLGRRLGRNLLAPLAPALAGARRVVFVGDDELVGLPLQALPLGTGLALDQYEFSYAPSLATYARWQAAARPHRGSAAAPGDLLAIGAVDADLQPAEAPSAEPALPFARAELAAIAGLFPRGRATTWIGAQANKANLRRASRSGALRAYRYVHFATHAWARADQPESSAIVLADPADDMAAGAPANRAGDAAPPRHGALTAAELAGLDMGSDLIVLSACDTGLGHFEHGRGLLGLAYASLAAGNRAALLSLWPVADDTTAEFMQQLYAKLRRGQAPPAALAATQREFQRSADARRADPLVWAPFVVYGGY